MSRSVFLGQVVINEFKEGDMLGVRVFIDSVCIYQQMPSTISDGMEALKRYVTQRWFDSAKPGPLLPDDKGPKVAATGNKCAKCGRGTFGALCARCAGERL